MVFGRESASNPAGIPLIIGHRGAAGLQPENTLPSFSQALSLGVDAVELDIYTVENQLVVIHDDLLQRTTNGTGPVVDCSLSELRALDAGSGARVPLLSEVFDLTGSSTGINVELKGPGTAGQLAAFLGDYPQHDVLVSSFDHQELRDFHNQRTGVPAAPLFHRWRSDVWEVADEFGAWSINLALRITNSQRISAAHERGYRVLVYTVNDVETARRLGAAAVDGVFTDFPDQITIDCLGDSALC
jgi:glycerophosphoryl diester phosphodiesterase